MISHRVYKYELFVIFLTLHFRGQERERERADEDSDKDVDDDAHSSVTMDKKRGTKREGERVR